jgi:hypothetical protein
MLEPYTQAISVRLTTEQTDIESMQVATDPITNTGMADYPTKSLRTKATVKSKY